MRTKIRFWNGPPKLRLLQPVRKLYPFNILDSVVSECRLALWFLYFLNWMITAVVGWVWKFARKDRSLGRKDFENGLSHGCARYNPSSVESGWSAFYDVHNSSTFACQQWVNIKSTAPIKSNVTIGTFPHGRHAIYNLEAQWRLLLPLHIRLLFLILIIIIEGFFEEKGQ